MFSSVRLRLTIWYTVSMTLVLLVLAGSTHFLLRRNLIRRADTQTVELADSFLSTVNAEMGDPAKPESMDEGIAAAISEHRFHDVVFAVFDPQGNLVGISSSYQRGDRQIQILRDPWAASLRDLVSSPEGFGFVRLEGGRYRSYVRQFSIDRQGGTLVVLQSLRAQHEFLETFDGTFSIVIPLAILLSGIGGYFLARRSLSPVVGMSEQASRIGSENLHERLKVSNPRDELGQLAGSFNELLDRLDQSFERQKKFVADASHELRTPVAILCGEADVALGQPKRTEEEYRESLEILRDEAKRLKRIVEDLFTLARADAGQYPLALADFYLDELAAECAKNVRTLASAKSIALSCESEGELLIHADETLVRRMLLNLLDNAIKYTPGGGKVVLQCDAQDGVYRVKVRDSGPGVPADLQSRIFERFFREDKVRSRREGESGGAGLGLAIASWIAGAHGGTIELTESSSDGSVFTVAFPKIPA
ncbi:MAG TPA: ATP-binding protein [Candidatus Sulfotelmatobacter sp.]|jgi:heavy metal sensor kinase